MSTNVLTPQRLRHHRLDGPTAVIACGYGVMLASLLISLASGNWEWFQSSGCVLGLCGWYLEKRATRVQIARTSVVFGTLIWGYTALLAG